MKSARRGQSSATQSDGVASRTPFRLSLCLYVALATMLWAMFHPGIMTDDSLNQIQQAERGSYSNNHPPIMAIILHAVVAVKGSVSFVIYVQCLLGLLGLRRLCVALIRLFKVHTVSNWIEEILALIWVLFLIAFTPLPFYLLYLVKDTWLTVSFLWLSSLMLEMIARPSPSAPTLIACMLLIIFACLVRYNAIPLLVVFCPLVFLLAPRWNILWPIVLVAAYFSVAISLPRMFEIEEEFPTHRVLLVDLVGMAVLQPAILEEMPFLKSTLRTDDYASRFKFGVQGYLSQFMDEKQAMTSDIKALRSEYRRVVLKHPITYVRTKIRAFHTLMRPDPVDQPHNFIAGIWSSGQQYEQNPEYADFRSAFVDRYYRLERDGRVAWLQSHVFWLTIAAILPVFGIYRQWRIPLLLLLSVPLLYGMTFVPFNIGYDYRFLLPSTLLLQAMVPLLVVYPVIEAVYARLVLHPRETFDRLISNPFLSDRQRRLWLFVLIPVSILWAVLVWWPFVPAASPPRGFSNAPALQPAEASGEAPDSSPGD
jgi:hypothetical protein